MLLYKIAKHTCTAHFSPADGAIYSTVIECSFVTLHVIPSDCSDMEVYRNKIASAL